MRRSQKILLFGFILVLAGLVYLEATTPPPVNWFASYSKMDKIPLGTFVLHKLMKDSFGEKFQETNNPPFEILQDSTFSGNYFFVNDIVNFDKTEMDSLFQWVEKGNYVFISANYFSSKMLDSLNLKISIESNVSKIGTEPLYKLVNKTLSSEKTFHIKKDLSVRYFSKIDTTTQTVLGVSGAYIDTTKIKNPRVNFIKIPMEKGAVFLHLQPEVFSNFALLSDDNSQYVSEVLAYINNGKPLYWDNYYKSGKHVDISPLRVLLDNKYFKWAYYFALIGILLFIVFEGKRKQRSVPIIKPLDNKTFEYTRTIAGLYLDKDEYHLVAQKQIALFMEFIRTRLRIPTEVINKRFYKAVAERSGNSHEDTLKLFTFIEKVNSQKDTSKEELMKLHREITDFKSASK